VLPAALLRQTKITYSFRMSGQSRSLRATLAFVSVSSLFTLMLATPPVNASQPGRFAITMGSGGWMYDLTVTATPIVTAAVDLEDCRSQNVFMDPTNLAGQRNAAGTTFETSPIPVCSTENHADAYGITFRGQRIGFDNSVTDVDCQFTVSHFIREWSRDRCTSSSLSLNVEFDDFNVTRVTATFDGASRILDAGSGVSRSEAKERPCTQTSDASVVEGTQDDDVICVTGDQPTTVLAKGGDDTIVVLSDADVTAYGGAGDDTFVGNAGDDTFEGGDGNDSAYGGKGNDDLNGGDGNDTLNGGSGDDDLDGADGFDNVNGGIGADSTPQDPADVAVSIDD
jgi:hypothetical protein